jgi:hypothetical protein
MRIVALLALAFLALAAACSDETIVLATAGDDDDDAGTTSGHTPVRCIRNDDCATNEFCDLDPIAPVPSGRCRLKPTFCQNEEPRPVCGRLHGITYLNDCYRKQAGESWKTEGICDEDVALYCDLSHPCPFKSVCALLGSGEPGKTCGPVSGYCWGIAKCHDDDDPFRWDECSTEGGALRCVSTCTAIQTGRPFTGHEGPCP